MAKVISEEQYASILEYVKNKMMSQSSIAVEDIVKLSDMAPYTGYVESVKGVKKKLAQVKENPLFQQFWEAYPATNKFEYKGRKFIPDHKRGLRSDYQVCQSKFENMVKTTGVSAEAYVKALKVDVASRMQKSYKKGTNELDHMPGIEVWLNNSRYFSTYLGEEMPIETTEQRIMDHTYNG